VSDADVLSSPHPPPIILEGCRRIGVLADTHIPHRTQEMPPAVFTALKGSDVILHAGDLESTEILEPLRRIAPTYAVRGNLHWQFSTGTHDQSLPLALTFKIGNHQLWMTHGHMRFTYSVIDKMKAFSEQRTLRGVNKALVARLRRMKPEGTTVVVFGHSHLSCAVVIDGVLYFNPGAAAASSTAKRHAIEKPRVGFLNFKGDSPIKFEWQEV